MCKEKEGRRERYMVKWESLIYKLGLCWFLLHLTEVVWIWHHFCWSLSSTEVNWKSYTEPGGHSCPGGQSKKTFMSTGVFSRSCAGMSLDCVILCTQNYKQVMQDAATICHRYIKSAKNKGFHPALWLWQRAMNTWIHLLQINDINECVTKYF